MASNSRFQWHSLCLISLLAAGCTKEITISNLQPRLYVDGNIIDAHDGSIQVSTVISIMLQLLILSCPRFVFSSASALPKTGHTICTLHNMAFARSPQTMVVTRQQTIVGSVSITTFLFGYRPISRLDLGSMLAMPFPFRYGIILF